MSKNPQIGTCPCPFKGCAEVMAVRRFEVKAPDVLQRRRKGGKLYADCPTHGRIGFDGIAGTQEYLLNKSDLWDAKKLEENADKESTARTAPQPSPAAKQERPPVPAPAKTSTASAQPASTQSAKKAGLFEW